MGPSASVDSSTLGDEQECAEHGAMHEKFVKTMTLPWLVEDVVVAFAIDLEESENSCSYPSCLGRVFDFEP